MWDRFEHTGIVYTHKPSKWEEEKAEFDEWQRQQDYDDKFCLAQDEGLNEADCDEFARGDWCTIGDYLQYRQEVEESWDRWSEWQPDLGV